MVCTNQIFLQYYWTDKISQLGLHEAVKLFLGKYQIQHSKIGIHLFQIKQCKFQKNALMDIVSPELTIQFYWGHLKKHHKCRIRRQTDLGWISLFLFPRIVWAIVLALETQAQDVTWPQEWLLTKCPDCQS